MSGEKDQDQVKNQAQEVNTEAEKQASMENLSDTSTNQEDLTEKLNTEQTPPPPPADTVIAEWQNKYLRLSADFDNYRKRTQREKMDLIKTAGEDILVSILPVVDDLDRAMKSIADATDINAVKAGLELIQGKFKDFLNQKGVKEIEAMNQPFSTDLHEAITNIPAPNEELKGKVVDVVQKGYLLNEKVIRYSKVVVGE